MGRKGLSVRALALLVAALMALPFPMIVGTADGAEPPGITGSQPPATGDWEIIETTVVSLMSQSPEAGGCEPVMPGGSAPSAVSEKMGTGRAIKAATSKANALTVSPFLPMVGLPTGLRPPPP